MALSTANKSLPVDYGISIHLLTFNIEENMKGENTYSNEHNIRKVQLYNLVFWAKRMYSGP
jgi:hypothetical protein